MRRAKERGFTLLELVLALSILAAMLVILFGGLRVSLRAWQRGEDHAQALQHTRAITQLVEQALAGTYIYQGLMDDASPQPQIFFMGEANTLSFVTASPPLPFPVPIPFTAVTLSTASGASGLVIREKPMPNFDPFESVPPSLTDPSITAIRFRYLRPTDGTWEDSWDAAAEQLMPKAIEVTLTAMVNGRVQDQPPITVPILVNSP